MTFSIHENIDLLSAEDPMDMKTIKITNRPTQKAGDFYLLSKKNTVPLLENFVERPRLTKMLKKSLEQYNAMILTGRTGTGKTSLAVEFSNKYAHIGWLSVESAEMNREIFFRYFLESFSEILPSETIRNLSAQTIGKHSADLPAMVEKLFSVADSYVENSPFLLVIDDIHNIFDADWFGAFFNRLLFSITPNIHLLMLSRSNPPFPLWRLRAKQVLGVIDEKLLAFDVEETRRLFEKLGVPMEKAVLACAKTLGRISHLKSIAREFHV